MDLGLSIGTADGAELEDLQDWLRTEPELRGRVRAQHTSNPGELGAVTDLLIVALGSGGAISVLAASLKAWFAQPRRSDIVVEIRTPGGTVKIDAKRVANAEALLSAALGYAADVSGEARSAAGEP